ncbi:ribosomal protein S18-alanine N-acetyltransferase [Legionella oakridgensis]|uniref:[Ribosomal protein bS18]-alanine N-acetyltransferase n=2 Tax=Legionella oakridgensis TaxID=29423 RepID=W0BFH0_9GAMM|nr:ribosomal protein S18-alanine N-acetyltransferase [Legionella oakridgensis]AHE67357.1 ribosomal-protein-alanine acetyltransferase [Legionella oakridgensis ATCC 33761 = DSM 21215]ETO93020.1 ribosomal-protein-alanine acetyltransferase [Legionella oakridgensis RV-2-2007]KTD43427.1 GCN5-related N-acetyltransferase [Legionella oakridgensis]STY20418.1 GCN5-related N-acetyltransferase [Legionella longbeachae]
MSYHIRPMTIDDVDDVYAIELSAHKAPWSRDILRDCVLVGYDCRVLESCERAEPEIISYIILRYYDHTCHILNLCVALASQGKGYGRLLLQNVIDSLVGSEVEALILEVRPSNLTAISLYKKMGFYQAGIKKDYYQDELGVEDAVLLKKDI